MTRNKIITRMLIACIGTAAAFQLAIAADIASLWSPQEIDMARQDYIENFDRIGMNSTPGDAQMLKILIQAAGCKRGIEVGAATGYGAIVMGVAFERTGGHLYTIDIDPDMVVKARENVKNMALEETVTVIEGDALKVLPEMEGKFDFIYLDAKKDDYFNYFKAIAPNLVPGSIIVADNVIRFGDDMRDFLDAMEQDPDFDMQIIQCSQEKSDGMAVIYKRN